VTVTPRAAEANEDGATRDGAGLDGAALAAAIDEHAAAIERVQTLLAAGHFGDDLRDELTLLARFVLVEHDRQEPLLRVMREHGDRVPELARQIRAKIVEPGYRYAADWIRLRIAEGGFAEYDADAVAVVALGSLLAYAAQRETFGGAPLGVDEDRFVATLGRRPVPEAIVG
jgi:hypothetical protein